MVVKAHVYTHTCAHTGYTFVERSIDNITVIEGERDL